MQEIGRRACRAEECGGFRDDLWGAEVNQQPAKLMIERLGERRIDGFELPDRSRRELGRRPPSAAATDRINADRAELLGAVQFCDSKLVQAREEARLQRGGSRAREREQRFELRSGIRFGERFLLPTLVRNALERDPRGVANKTVRMPKLRPDDRKRIVFCFAMQVFKAVPLRPKFRGVGIRLWRTRRGGSRKANPIKTGAGPASARQKIHGAVRSERDVGDIQWPPRDERLSVAAILAPSGCISTARILPYAQSAMKSARRHRSGNRLRVPNSTPHGEPMPISTTLGRVSGK